jgi:hypothetical protein
MITAYRSRPADDGSEMLPFAKLFEIASQEAQQAEVLLLRKLLVRAYGVLQDVATEARADGEPDAMTETLMRDISTALDRRPTLI